MARLRARWHRHLAGLGLAASATLVMAVSTAVPAAATEGNILYSGSPTAIAGSYIVVFKDTNMTASGVGALTSSLAAKSAAKVDHTYTAALRGFAGTMSERAAKKLAADPAVSYVAQNRTVSLAGTQPNPPSWGLDRIDQRDLPLNSSYTYPNTGSGVTAYIIDTGIRITHQDFGGRAVWGTNTVGDGNNTDCHGHGTHVSGTVGGNSYGVAKSVNLVAVKVLDCNGSGSFAGVAAGVDWVTQQHAAGAPAVANMSLGGSGSDATTENAVRNSIADGVVYAIASGNSNSDACNFTPARVAEAITVNASDSSDARASFSNFGTCTDIFGPGVNITSAWNTSDTATNTISGTSMATPHVAGGAALILGGTPSLTPAQVWTQMSNNATLNHITNPGTGSPNKLLFVNTGAPGGPTVTNPGNQTGTVGTPTSLQMSASGGTPPYTWSANGLPPGLTINSSTGLISGTPTTASTYTPTVTATDSASQPGSTTFTWTINPAGGGCTNPGQKLVNPGFESGSTGWTATAGVIGTWTGIGAPRTGSWSAWLDGYGTNHTDTLQQTVTIPAGCTNSTLSFYLKIDSSETTTTIPYDTLTVQVNSTTLATYSNLNESGYLLRSFNVGSFAGQTVTVKFTGVEDISLQTSFVIDDTALNAS